MHWVCLRSVEIPLSEITQDFSEIQIQLQQLTASWRIPNGAPVSWVLPSDIVGAFNFCKQNDIATDISSFSPFNLNDLRVSELIKNSAMYQTIYWTHKDWSNEIARISEQLNWTCVEFFSRAQLFIKIFPKQESEYSLLLEGHGLDVSLHIYAFSGSILRTTKVSANHAPDLAAFVKKEVKSLPLKMTNDFQLFVLNVDPELVQSLQRDFKVEQLPLNSSIALMSRLLLSSEEGIELSPTYGSLLSRVNAFSLAIAIAASAMFSIAVWYDGVLQSDIDLNRRQLRKETARFQTAKYVRAETIKMADAVRAKQSIVVEPSSFKLLAEVLPALTVPASLSYFDQNGRTLKIAGIQGESEAVKSSMEKNPIFLDVHITVAPEELKADKQVFSLEFLWRDVDREIHEATVPKAMK